MLSLYKMVIEAYNGLNYVRNITIFHNKRVNDFLVEVQWCLKGRLVIFHVYKTVIIFILT